MKIYDYPSRAGEKKVAGLVNRGLAFSQKDYHQVKRIVEDVRRNGDAALLAYARRFDAPGLTTAAMQVSAAEFEAAAKRVDRSFMRALNRAAARIKAFHRHQADKSWMTTERAGILLGQLVNPVEAVGVYVPGGQGGRTPLVSSVLMTAIPAKIAGVAAIVMATPPMADGTVNAHLLVAARKAGISAVYKVGSAWAIAALAYGTATVPRVDVIAGPGNIYVTLAKKIVAGRVGIDMVAGPSEVLVIADQTANAEFIAADLLSQAEHDALASAVLVTDSRAAAAAVAAALKNRLAQLPRRQIATRALAQFGAILVVENLDVAFDLANRIAPEHLELQIQDPFAYVGRVRHAGAVFLGPYSPEPVGDYMAGPNHVLPTAGTARFASALSVAHFTKKTSLIYYSKAAFLREAKDTIRLAQIEGLDAHAAAIRARL